MNRLLATAAAAALAAGLAMPAAANTLRFQMNPNFDTGGVRQLFLFGQAGASGTVTNGAGFSSAFTLGADGFAVLNIPVGNELGSATIENKGFLVNSSQAISGYYLSKRANSTDMTYLIDGSRLGTDHVVAGYQNIQPDQISVQASVDNTTVTFRPIGAAEFQVTLNAGQTYMYTATTNLTGSRVLASSPIAVFSGNRCTNIPTNVGACDHIVEQMPSVDKLSSSYLLAQTPRTGTLGNVYRAVATQDNTTITQNGVVVATLNAGQFHEGRVAGGVELVGSKPILVAQYLIGQGQASANTDPAMTIVPGADQWLSSYVFATPSGAADFPVDFVSIIIRTTDLSTLTLDGSPANTSGFQVLGSTLFSFGNIDVSSTVGAFSISAANPFQLLLSGFNDFDSYFTYGGAAFSPGASPPPDEEPPPPDNTARVYWDGNGPNGDGIVQGGDGTWTTTSGNFTNANGAGFGANNPQPSTVIFGGTGGTVTVSNANGPVTVTGMTFTVNGYTITGDAVTLSGATANLTVEGADNTATIAAPLTGASALVKLGAGTLSLTNASNSYAGGTVISEGTLRGVLGAFGSGDISVGSRLVLDVGANGALANLLTGSGAIEKTGTGVLTINGSNGFSGSFAVNGGGLAVLGTLPAAVALNAGTLSGTGTIGSLVAASGTVVAPGPVVGTLTVTGNASFLSGSRYNVDVTSTGTSDRIVSATANIASGTTLNVTKTDAPRLVLGTRYTVLSTGPSGRTGSFAALTGDTRVSQFISVVQELDASNIYLGVRQTGSFASAAGTPNQIAAATGADNTGNGSLYNAIAYLPDATSARAAFDQVSGEIHATARGQTVQDSRFVREALSAHLQSPSESRKGLWVSAYGSWGRTDGDGNAAKVSRDIGGFFMGGDVLQGENYSAGVLAGYGTATINVADRFSRATTDDFHVGAYGGFTSGNVIGHVALVHMWRNLDTRRTVSFPGFSDTLTAAYRTNLTQMLAELGYRFDAGDIAIEPFAQVAYLDVTTNAIAESGGAARLASGKTSDDFWVTTLGARVKYGLPLGNGSFGVTAEAGWRHVGDGRETTPISFNLPAGPGFAIQGVPFGRDVAALGLILSGSVAKNVEIDFGYRGQVGAGVKDHGVRGGVVVRF